MREHEIDLLRAVWRKASYSNGNGECVEVADVDGGNRAVRDSKDRAGPVLMVTPGEWSAFTAAVRAGEIG